MLAEAPPTLIVGGAFTVANFLFWMRLEHRLTKLETLMEIQRQRK